MIERLLRDEIDEKGAYVSEVIYGANDGIITTFAVVSGAAGASLDPAVVVILGAANLFADGFSMGMSNFLSQRSAIDYHTAQGTTEVRSGKPPAYTAFVTFLAFVVVGWAPLLPYVLGVEGAFPASVVAAGAAFFLVGAGRVLVTDRRWYTAGVEMFVVGMFAAIVAYVVGFVLGGVGA
jgi:VIT1/CCC1 family predicted Fe2+/Mn2+ transporter